MKYKYHILLLFVLLSCRGKDYWKERSEGLYDYNYRIAVEKYNPIYQTFIDSFYCSVACKNHVGVQRFSDSADRYYKLMYPNGNPARIRMGNDKKCDCR